MRPRSVSDIRWQGKTALVRADLNTPLTRGDNGAVQVADDARIRAALPTLQRIAQNGGKAVILSHLGRPKGKHHPELSLAPVAEALQNALGEPVSFSPTHPTPTHPSHPSALSPLPNPSPSETGIGIGTKTETAKSAVFRLLENTRFNPGESENDAELAKAFARMGDVFVMDAFACAHRAEASVCALAEFAAEKCVGLLVEKEIAALERVLQNPRRPVVGIFGGAKISDKIPVVGNLAGKMDSVLVGGGAANTLLLAANRPIGKSLAQRDAVDDAKKILALGNVRLPEDAVVATSLQNESEARNAPLSELSEAEMILDIGEKTRDEFARVIRAAGTIIWNGPMGVFESPAFSGGTREVAEAVAKSDGYSLAGGGETLAAIARFGVGGGISHLSTGGGALLEYLSGRELPGLAAVGAQ